MYKYKVICKNCGNEFRILSFFSFFQLEFFGVKTYCDRCTKIFRKMPLAKKEGLNKIFLIYD